MKTTVCSIFSVKSSGVSNENPSRINRSRVQLVEEISEYKYRHQGDMPTTKLGAYSIGVFFVPTRCSQSLVPLLLPHS